jgi:hypothetical protein
MLVWATGLSGCVTQPPEDTPVFEPASSPLRLESQAHLVEALVELDGDRIAQEPITFIVALEPASGVSDADLVDVRPFMPAHGHGTIMGPLEPLDGTYILRDIVLFMPGRWEITLDFVADGVDDAATFAVDVP